MRIYGLKTCDTCRKALKLLPDAALVDVRAEGVPAEIMKAAQEKFGDALLNTRSTTWRGLSEEERQRDPRDLLAAYPALLKRPLIARDGDLFLGWGKDVQQALLG